MGEKAPFVVLWDMDGVLVDSSPYHYRAWKDTLAEEGLALDEATFRRTFGQRNDAIIADVLGPDLPRERVAAIGAAKERRYRALIAQEGLMPLPGALDWLRRLHRQGIPQAVVSSAPRENIEAVLEALGISGLFQALISGEEVEQGKPDPASFLLAAQRLGMSPKRCVVVEDAPAGVEAAHRAGMVCLAVATTHPRERLVAADEVTESLDELPEGAFERLIRRAG
ncbi:MAG: HAD family hydrolase [Chloroflexia bacterium]